MDIYLPEYINISCLKGICTGVEEGKIKGKLCIYNVKSKRLLFKTHNVF